MVQTIATPTGTFTPASREDFGARARFLSKLLRQPYQRCQEGLARLYGYSDLHQLQTAIKRAEADPSLAGPYDQEWARNTLEGGPKIDLAGRSNGTLEMACALSDVTLESANPRIWDARELGLFDPLPTLRVQAKNILAKHDLLDTARDPSKLVPDANREASDYGHLYRNGHGEAMIAFTALGRSVHDAIKDIELDEHAEPIDTYERLRNIVMLHPNNPWALTDLAAHTGVGFGQAPWSFYIESNYDNGANPPGDDLKRASRFYGEETLLNARRAVELFEELYGSAEKTTLASTKLVGTISPHGTDTKGFAEALYWAGMAADNDARRNRSRQAANWLSRSAKFKKDTDVLTRLSILAFHRGDKRPQRYLKGYQFAPTYLVELTVALRDRSWEKAADALGELLNSSSQFIRCIDDSFRECDRYHSQAYGHTRLDLDEVIWRLGLLSIHKPPHYVALLRTVIANEELRRAYVACWNANEEAFGCGLKEPAEYIHLSGQRDDARLALKKAAREAVAELTAA